MGEVIDKKEDFQRLVNIRDELWLLAEHAKSMTVDFQTKMNSIYRESQQLNHEFSTLRERMSNGKYTLTDCAVVEGSGGFGEVNVPDTDDRQE